MANKLSKMILISPASLERLKKKYSSIGGAPNSTVNHSKVAKSDDKWLKQKQLLDLLSIKNRRKPSTYFQKQHYKRGLDPDYATVNTSTIPYLPITEYDYGMGNSEDEDEKEDAPLINSLLELPHLQKLRSQQQQQQNQFITTAQVHQPSSFTPLPSASSPSSLNAANSSKHNTPVSTWQVIREDVQNQQQQQNPLTPKNQSFNKGMNGSKTVVIKKNARNIIPKNPNIARSPVGAPIGAPVQTPEGRAIKQNQNSNRRQLTWEIPMTPKERKQNNRFKK